jgi:hypothetical protein
MPKIDFSAGADRKSRLWLETAVEWRRRCEVMLRRGGRSVTVQVMGGNNS